MTNLKIDKETLGWLRCCCNLPVGPISKVTAKSKSVKIRKWRLRS